MRFEDHFSKQAQTYAQYRPGYPTELYDYLAGIAPGNELAWDCATGSGQAAVDLANYYNQVIATDASTEQVSRAQQHPKVIYRVEPAEKTSLISKSVDLITVATAVHWFDFDPFYQEARRVLKPEGIIAVWTYHRPIISPQVDSLIIHLEMDILKDYWPERIRYLREHYQTLPFPFEELPQPEFSMTPHWDLDQMVGFISSWSAVQKYEEEHGVHPLKSIWDEFQAAWRDESQPRVFSWPLYLRIGRC